MVSFRITLGEQTVPVFAGSSTSDRLGEVCQLYHFEPRVLLLTTPSLHSRFLPGLLQSLQKAGFHVQGLVVPERSQATPLQVTESIIGKVSSEAPSSFTLIGLGGGRLLSICGLMQSLWNRSMTFVSIPTSLLSQADCCFSDEAVLDVGKYPQVLRTSYRTHLIWIDTAFLEHLPPEAYDGGLLNLIRLATLWDDTLFSYLEFKWDLLRQRELPLLVKVIQRAALLKEQLLRRESESPEKRPLQHGYSLVQILLPEIPSPSYQDWYRALGLSILWEWGISLELGMGRPEDFHRVYQLIRSVLSFQETEKNQWCELLDRIQQKWNGWKPPLLALPKAIGSLTFSSDLDSRVMESGLQKLKAFISKGEAP